MDDIVINYDLPLPPRLDKEWWETYAKVILEYSLPDCFQNLDVEGERPDLRNEVLDIGIEVTCVDPEKMRKLDSVYSRSFSFDDEKQEQEAMKKIKKLNGRVEYGALFHPVRDRDLGRIYDGVVKKTKKLNDDGFKIFGKNDLFIFTSDYIYEKELDKVIFEISKRINNETFLHSFDEIFVFYLGGELYRLNIRDGFGEHIKSFIDEWKLGEKARTIIERKYK